MPNQPGIQEVHIDSALSAFSIMYKNAGFIGEVLFPTIKVTKESGIFWKYPEKYMFKNRDARRAPGTAAKSIYYTLDRDTFFCEGYALNKEIPDEVRDNQDDPIDVEFDSTALVTENIMLNREIRYADIARAVATYPAGHYSTPSPLWSAANSTPIEDILNVACRKIHSKIFRKPNLIIIPYEVAIVFSWNSEIKELVKYVGNEKYELLKIEEGILLPKVLWGMKVVIPEAGYNTANLGQTASLSYIWGKDVIVAYVDPSPKLRTLTFAATFEWKERQTRKWYENRPKSTVIEVEEWTDEKVVANTCAYLLQACIA